MKRFRFALIATIACGTWATHARANATYVWTEATVGSSEWAGTIVLDSSSNTNGTLSDVVSVILVTPQGNFTYDPATAFDDSCCGNGGFSWNASQIEHMYFGWQDYPYQPSVFEGVGYGPGGLQVNSLVGPLSSFDENGSWLAATSGTPEPPVIDAPEPATWTTMLIGLAGLCFAEWRRNPRAKKALGNSRIQPRNRAVTHVVAPRDVAQAFSGIAAA